MIDAVDVVEVELPLRTPFRIARGTTRRVQGLFLRLEVDGEVGWGQAHPSPAVTGEAPEATRRALQELTPEDLDPAGPQASLARLEQAGPAARAAVDLALHDLEGARRGETAWALLGLPEGALPSAATITIDEPEGAAEQARRWTGSGFTQLKVKVGDESQILETLDAVRQAMPAEVRAPMAAPELWVDANGSLTLEQAHALVPELVERDIALLEQPLAPGELAATAELAEATELPILVDEDVLGPEDVRSIGELDAPVGVNVKVQKVGGLLAARSCIEEAREAELPVLVGCNIETGLGIAAGAALAGAVDRADLDGNLFLEQDPFPLPRPMPGHVGTLAGDGLGVNADPRFLENAGIPRTG